MKNEPVVSDRNEFVGNVACKLFLYTIGRSTTRWHESYAMTHTEDMRIYRKGSLTPHNRLDDVGRLTPHAR